MRKLIMLLTSAAIIVSCKSEPKVDYALLSGKIENPTGSGIIITGNEFKKEINLNDDGTFADTLKLATNGYFTFFQGRNASKIYLANGDDINMTFDAFQYAETILFTGKGAEANSYLSNKLKEDMKATMNRAAFYSLEEDAFKQKLDEIKNGHLKSLESSNAASDFIELEKKNLDYDTYNHLASYQRMHAHFASKPNFQVSEDFLPEELTTMTFDNVEYYGNFTSYKSLAMNNYMEKIVESLGVDFQIAAPEDFKVFEEIKIPALKNDIMSNIGMFLVSPGNPNMVALYEFFMDNATDDDLKKSLTTKYDQNKELVRGKPSPVFTNYENHKGGTMSLADLRGKYVYIDVWATWCGPCIKEIPSLKALEAKYHDKNIEFVSTSIDVMKDHEAWVEMVKDKQLGGHQLFADKNWQSDFIRGYGIEGIPRFILIDPDGNIVSADAPRPSNPKLIELFNELKI